MTKLKNIFVIFIIFLLGMIIGIQIYKSHNEHNIVLADTKTVKQIFQCQVDSLTRDNGIMQSYIDELHRSIFLEKEKLKKEKEKKKIRWYDVTVTGYTASLDESDGDPTNTATMTRPTPGRTVALSRDLFKKFKGKHIHIDGVGVFVAEDTMNPRFNNRIDILFRTKEEAFNWGKRPFMRFRVVDQPRGNET